MIASIVDIFMSHYFKVTKIENGKVVRTRRLHHTENLRRCIIMFAVGGGAKFKLPEIVTVN